MRSHWLITFTLTGLLCINGCTDKLVGKWKPVSTRSAGQVTEVLAGPNEGVTVEKLGDGYQITGPTGKVFTGTVKGKVVEFIIDEQAGVKAVMQIDPISPHLLIRLKPIQSNPMIPQPLQAFGNVLIEYERVN